MLVLFWNVKIKISPYILKFFSKITYIRSPGNYVNPGEMSSEVVEFQF